MIVALLNQKGGVGKTKQDYLLTAFMSTGANVQLPAGAAPVAQEY